jgi:hypothetical protein
MQQVYYSRHLVTLRSLKIERQQARQYLLIIQISRPAIRIKDRRI